MPQNLLIYHHHTMVGVWTEYCIEFCTYLFSGGYPQGDQHCPFQRSTINWLNSLQLFLGYSSVYLLSIPLSVPHHHPLPLSLRPLYNCFTASDCSNPLGHTVKSEGEIESNIETQLSENTIVIPEEMATWHSFMAKKGCWMLLNLLHNHHNSQVHKLSKALQLNG